MKPHFLSQAFFYHNIKCMTKNLNTSNFGAYVGRKSTFEISSIPCLTNDLALRPCFKFLIGLTYMSLCSPTEYAHTRAMQATASRRAIRLLSRRRVSSRLKSEYETGPNDRVAKAVASNTRMKIPSNLVVVIEIPFQTVANTVMGLAVLFVVSIKRIINHEMDLLLAS